jgi:hypothetical protein
MWKIYGPTKCLYGIISKDTQAEKMWDPHRSPGEDEIRS